jgi:basic membrane protein A
VFVVYRDDGSREKLFIDEEWGFENAQGLIQDGADVLFAVGGETGVGALRATNEARIHAIGAERDQRGALGEEGSGVVTSVLGRASSTVQELMRSIKTGNLADAQMSPIGYVSLESIVLKSLIDEMNAILSGLISGEIKTGVLNEKP